ncbi:MAG: hypothetical protein WAW92_04150 [Minisyncoccia bacterium]
MTRSGKTILKYGLLGLLGLVIVSYSVFQAWKIIEGPVISILSPENGRTFNETLISIEGQAKNVSHLYLNDRPIYTDKNGYFNEKFLLSPGYNIVKLNAVDKFRKYTEKRLYLVLKDY